MCKACMMIPKTKIPTIIAIGDTFFFNNHIAKNVNANPIKPGTKLSKFACNVFGAIFVNDKPASLITQRFVATYHQSQRHLGNQCKPLQPTS